MAILCLITNHQPMADEPLLAPVVVATITTDKRMVRRLDATTILSQIAAKLGLLQYSIVDGESQEVPGYQYELFVYRS